MTLMDDYMDKNVMEYCTFEDNYFANTTQPDMDKQINKPNTSIQENRDWCFISKTQDASNTKDEKCETENLFDLGRDEGDQTFTQRLAASNSRYIPVPRERSNTLESTLTS